MDFHSISSNTFLLQEMYEKIESNDEGDITMKEVVAHIKGVEAGSGKNEWVQSHSSVHA